MGEKESELAVEADEFTASDFDHLTGIIVDGFVGALGGLVGTAALTIGLLIASTLGVFEISSFAKLVDLFALNALVTLDPVAVGYLVFLGAGMTIWPLLFASIGSYLPGDTCAIKGISYGFVLWTGFVMAFYDGYAGTALVLYAVLTLLAHFAYGFSLGAVFDYLSGRPDTLV